MRDLGGGMGGRGGWAAGRGGEKEGRQGRGRGREGGRGGEGKGDIGMNGELWCGWSYGPVIGVGPTNTCIK